MNISVKLGNLYSLDSMADKKVLRGFVTAQRGIILGIRVRDTYSRDSPL